jgi:Integrase zinc binding domain
MNEQQSDDYCQSMLQLMMERETEYSVDDRGLIVRLDPKTGRTQICIPKSLRERIMTLGHYPQIAGHPGGTRMYQNIRRELFWPRMAIDIHHFVQNCALCARKRLVTQRKTTYLKLFPPSAPLEFVAMDILGPLPET